MSNGRAKLSDLQVEKIRSCKGKYSSYKVADMYGICQQYVCDLWNNKKRKEVSGVYD